MDLLGNLLRHSSLPLSLLDPGKDEIELTFVNKAFEKMTGYRRQDLIDRPCPLFQGPTIDGNAVSDLKIARDEGKRVSRVFWVTTADGEPFECLTYIDPIEVSPGVVVMLGCHFALSPALSKAPRTGHFANGSFLPSELPAPTGENAINVGENRNSEILNFEDSKDELLDYARKALLRCIEMRRNTLYSRIDLYFNRRRGNLMGGQPDDIDAAAMARDPLLGRRGNQA
ncbi:PAS domain-containing protein [Phaeobacter porticola]|uniref:PAS domain protein n=1 Tax=Phaeobacter porticola TaxID=1844006 RepID=A0A1L3I7M2_9RHOB|nr:PAS domain-containing protein [Phaeobacter porticola]APG48168.1 PAS domain protein [Phaeobacter porticola]